MFAVLRLGSFSTRALPTCASLHSPESNRHKNSPCPRKHTRLSPLREHPENVELDRLRCRTLTDIGCMQSHLRANRPAWSDLPKQIAQDERLAYVVGRPLAGRRFHRRTRTHRDRAGRLPWRLRVPRGESFDYASPDTRGYRRSSYTARTKMAEPD